MQGKEVPSPHTGAAEIYGKEIASLSCCTSGSYHSSAVLLSAPVLSGWWTVGIIVFDILVGGIIGVFVLIWKIIAGLGCLALCITKLIVKIIQQREA